jgi:hypothetical protein
MCHLYERSCADIQDLVLRYLLDCHTYALCKEMAQESITAAAGEPQPGIKSTFWLALSRMQFFLRGRAWSLSLLV